jgi:hypothetical protein
MPLNVKYHAIVQEAIVPTGAESDQAPLPRTLLVHDMTL